MGPEARTENSADVLRTVQGSPLFPLLFGTWPISGWYFDSVDDQTAIDLIHYAMDHRINGFDTAPIYGPEHSERILGKAWKGENRESLFLISKGGLEFRSAKGKFFFTLEKTEWSGMVREIPVHIHLSKEALISQCEDSLRRIRTEYLDLFMIHWPAREMDFDEILEAITRLKNAGKIRYAGVSNFQAAQIAGLMGEGMQRQAGPVEILMDQERFNLVSRKALAGNIPFTRKNNVHFSAYSPFAQGLLTGSTGKPGAAQRFSHRKNAKTLAEEIDSAWESLAGEFEQIHTRKGELSLRWVLSTPGINSVVAGFRSREQLNSAMRNITEPLSGQAYQALEKAFEPYIYEGK